MRVGRAQSSTDIDVMAEAVSGVVDVFFGPRFQGCFFWVFQSAHDLGGTAENHAARRDDCALGDESISADDRLRTDNGAVENGCAHADETFVLDGAGVNNG